MFLSEFGLPCRWLVPFGEDNLALAVSRLNPCASSRLGPLTVVSIHFSARKELPMRPPPVLLILLLCLVVLAGCEQRNVAPLAQALFPTATPTLVPSPTPTRVDEVVIPFESVAINHLISIPPVGGTPASVTSATPFYDSDLGNFQESLTVVLLSQQDILTYAKWYSPETVAALEQVDYVEYFVLGTFFGLGSPCCDGYIQRLAVTNEARLEVHLVLRHGSSGAAEITFPYHMLKIRRHDMPIPIRHDMLIDVNVETLIIN